MATVSMIVCDAYDRSIADAIVMKRYDMDEHVIRVKPRSFDCNWRQDLIDVGFKLSDHLTVQQYAPVNHNPAPFSIEIDMHTKTVIKKIVGVMPNATYKGHIYSWDEFLKLIVCDSAESNERKY